MLDSNNIPVRKNGLQRPYPLRFIALVIIYTLSIPVLVVQPMYLSSPWNIIAWTLMTFFAVGGLGTSFIIILWDIGEKEVIQAPITTLTGRYTLSHSVEQSTVDLFENDDNLLFSPISPSREPILRQTPSLFSAPSPSSPLYPIPPHQHCDRCNLWVRTGSIHCKFCQKCIHNLDHHCFFLNACIGSRNYRLFICALLWGAVFFGVSVSVGVGTGMGRLAVATGVSGDGMVWAVWTVLMVLVHLIAFIFITDLIRIHIILCTL